MSREKRQRLDKNQSQGLDKDKIRDQFKIKSGLDKNKIRDWFKIKSKTRSRLVED